MTTPTDQRQPLDLDPIRRAYAVYSAACGRHWEDAAAKQCALLIPDLLGEIERMTGVRDDWVQAYDTLDLHLGRATGALVQAEGAARDWELRARAERDRADGAEMEAAGRRARVDQLEAALEEAQGALATVEEELAGCRYQLTEAGIAAAGGGAA